MKLSYYGAVVVWRFRQIGLIFHVIPDVGEDAAQLPSQLLLVASTPTGVVQVPSVTLSFTQIPAEHYPAPGNVSHIGERLNDSLDKLATSLNAGFSGGVVNDDVMQVISAVPNLGRYASEVFEAARQTQLQAQH